MKVTYKGWEKFEIAVKNFVSALDPHAKVTHNKKLPDLDTGEPRQRDVWVETTVCNLFPVKILISCKKTSEKINQQDLDAFIGELRSSGAHKGVMYSYSGFTTPAIKKAKAVGISCCKLYEDEPPDIPETLIISFFCCYSSYRLRINSESLLDWGNLTFKEIFDTKDNSENMSSKTLIENLDAAFLNEQKSRIEKALNGNKFPEPWSVAAKIDKHNMRELIVYLEGKWRIYRGKIEAHNIDGSYSFTENQFTGVITSPWLDVQSPEPGPNWELVTDLHDSENLPRGTIILQAESCKDDLYNRYSDTLLKNISKSEYKLV